MTTPMETPQGNWWAQRPLWQKIALIVGGVFVALVVLGMIVGDPDDSGTAADTTVTTAPGETTSTADETTTTAAETTTTADTTTTTAAEETTTTAAKATTTSQPEDTTTTTEASTTTTNAYLTFGDGTWIIGTDIEPGTYRNDDSSALCLWQRLSGFSGEFDDIIASDLTEAITIVTIDATDAGFDSEDCSTWSTDLSPRTSSPEADFGDGTWIVGSDIAPGLWRNDDSSALCLWQRLSGFSGEFDDIIASDLTEAVATVEISGSDVGFDAVDCGTWTKIG
jgi:hypothetical protein